MTRPPLPPHAGRRRIRFTTGVTAAAATTAAALLGVLFAQPSPTQASPAAADLPLVEPPPRTEPSTSSGAATPTGTTATAPKRAADASPTHGARRHDTRRSTPVQPPPRPPARSSGRGNVSSGAS